jgi:hypoxanthine phosphoribosyltransferase
MIEKEFVQPNDLVRDSFVLARQIYDSGFVPDVLIVLWRGGAPVGVSIHEFLSYKGIETYHTVVKVVSYTDIDERRTPVIEHFDRVLSEITSETRVLVVDDIFDSGSTMQAVMERLSPLTTHVRLATLYFKPAANTTELEPDYFLKKTDRWIVFPHELVGLTGAEILAKDSFIADLLA